MQEFIDKVNLFEMPGLLSGSIDFGLDNDSTNMAKAETMMKILNRM